MPCASEQMHDLHCKAIQAEGFSDDTALSTPPGTRPLQLSQIGMPICSKDTAERCTPLRLAGAITQRWKWQGHIVPSSDLGWVSHQTQAAA